MAQSTSFHLPPNTGSTGTALVSTSGVVSPARVITGKIVGIDAQLTSTGDWQLQAGTGCFSWGMEYSSDGGNSWRWAIHVPGDGADPETFLIGAMGIRSGGMPTIGIGGGNFKNLVGSRLRLRAATSPRSSSPGSSPAVLVGVDVTIRTT